MSKFWKSLLKSLKTKLALSSAYHPQTDGQSEIVNRKVEEMIRAFVNFQKDNWDDHLVDFEVGLESAAFSSFYRISYHILNKSYFMSTQVILDVQTNNCKTYMSMCNVLK